MISLITAALAAAQPMAPMTPAMAPMTHEQHEAAKDKCCCDKMAKGEHEMHASGAMPQDHHGQ